MLVRQVLAPARTMVRAAMRTAVSERLVTVVVENGTAGDFREFSWSCRCAGSGPSGLVSGGASGGAGSSAPQRSCDNMLGMDMLEPQLKVRTQGCCCRICFGLLARLGNAATTAPHANVHACTAGGPAGAHVLQGAGSARELRAVRSAQLPRRAPRGGRRRRLARGARLGACCISF